MLDYDTENICDLIRSDWNSKPSPWHHIGYRNGHKLFCTESTLRRATVEQLLDDDSIEPLRSPRKRAVPKPKPWIPDGLLWELLDWLCSSLGDMMSGSCR